MERVQLPLVTVVTLVYNTGARMRETLASIQAQTYKNFEHIIIDDCSTDDSVAIVEQWIRENDYPCTFIKHEKNQGICKSSNEALRLAKGKYTAGIGDDIMMHYKLERDVAFMEAHPDYAFCYSNMVLRYVAEQREVAEATTPSDNLFDDYVLGKTSINTPTVMYRRSALEEAGGFDETILFEDYDMYLRLLSKHKAGFNPYYSVVYNIWGQSIQMTRSLDFHKEFLNILTKWKDHPRYTYYLRNRHLYTFCQLAVKNKKEALRHLGPSLHLLSQPRLYKNLLKLFFVWK